LECVEGSGREITVCYSPPKLVQLSWAPALCSWISQEQTYGDCGKNTSRHVSRINRQTDLTNSRWNVVTSLVGHFRVISLATIVLTCNLIQWTTSHNFQAYLGLLMRLFKHDLVNCWSWLCCMV
jgi:hypothetical protein